MIGSYLGVLADDLPIVIVGEVGEEGYELGESQGGPLLTISAMADEVFCANNVGDTVIVVTGTSYGTS
jgi:hypothetical protein